jgi:ssDNA-binding Zn-finger/Zn-ribbon topoisomerase 1
MKGERTDLVCPECGAPMHLRYSRKHQRSFYGCTRWPACSGTHGAHDDGRPKGVPGDAATRNARMRAHDVFDQLWKPRGRGRMSRRGAYRWMRQAMGLTPAEAHIGNFNTTQCEQLVQLVQQWLAQPPEEG